MKFKDEITLSEYVEFFRKELDPHRKVTYEGSKYRYLLSRDPGVAVLYRDVVGFFMRNQVAFGEVKVKLTHKEYNEFYSKEMEMKNPSLELKPRRLHKEERRDEICEALIRHAKAGKELPIEWVEEFNELVKELNK